MKFVYEPLGATLNLIGEQKISNNIYRPFQYVYDYVIDDGHLLYNVLTRELLLLSEDEIKKFHDEIDLNDKICKYLIKHWFLVPVEHDDAKLSKQTREFLRTVVYSNTNAPIRQFTILPTTDCNARCFYCFELGRSRKDMTEETAIDVANYILKASCGQKFRIRWFGGEPLCNVKAIDVITNILHQNGAEFTCNFTSNGYLFDDENVKKAVELWNTTDVQVTLDGTEEIYNRCKAFIYNDGRSSFKVVTDNIERLLKAGLVVKVRMNMDSHNEKDLYKLTDYLLERFGAYNKFYAYVHLLFEDSSKVQSNRNDEERHQMIRSFFAFEDYLKDKQKNFPTRRVNKLIQYRQCMADDPTSTSIMPNGELGKCEHYSDTDFWGSIYSNKINYDVIEDFRRIKYMGKHCDDCVLYPMCIQLLRCAQTIPNRCDDVDKMLHFRNIERAILATYKDFLKESK